MARRRKSEDLRGLLASFVGLLFALFVLTPSTRALAPHWGPLLVLLVVLVILGLFLTLAIAIWRSGGDATGSPVADLAGPHYRAAVVIPPHLPISAPPPVPEPRLPSRPKLVHHLRNIDWFQFEKIVALAFRKQGYAVTRRGGANPDGGIDLVLERNGETTAVQCKHWKTWKLGVATVREFLGALTDAGIPRGTIISLNGSTAAAQSLAAKHHINLLGEEDLAHLLERTSARYDPAVLAVLEDKRKLCPRCEHEMVLRQARSGPNAGGKFWGCSRYPRCRYTMPADA
jgi:restriction system protein